MSNVVDGRDVALQPHTQSHAGQPRGRLYALGDLHLSFKANREALGTLAAHPDDSLILCGDVGETSDHLALAFRTARARLKHVIWVPGNQELYTLPPVDT